MLKLIIVLSLLLSGCAGLGLNKKCTVIPDSVGLEADLDPNADFDVKTVEARATWNLK